MTSSRTIILSALADVASGLGEDLEQVVFETGVGRVYDFVRNELRVLSVSEAFEDATFGCFPGDNASQLKAAELIDRLRGV